MSARRQPTLIEPGDSGHEGECLREAAEFWTRRAGRPVTHEDARVISENLTGLFSLLREWQVKADEPANLMLGKADEAGGQA